MSYRIYYQMKDYSRDRDNYPFVSYDDVEFLEADTKSDLLKIIDETTQWYTNNELKHIMEENFHYDSEVEWMRERLSVLWRSTYKWRELVFVSPIVEIDDEVLHKDFTKDAFSKLEAAIKKEIEHRLRKLNKEALEEQKKIEKKEREYLKVLKSKYPND